MRELISATTRSAHSAAARVASTLAPMVQKPCSSARHRLKGKHTGRRKVEQAHVHVIVAITKESRNLAEEDGNLGLSSAMHRCT